MLSRLLVSQQFYTINYGPSFGHALPDCDAHRTFMGCLFVRLRYLALHSKVYGLSVGQLCQAALHMHFRTIAAQKTYYSASSESEEMIDSNILRAALGGNKNEVKEHLIARMLGRPLAS